MHRFAVALLAVLVASCTTNGSAEDPGPTSPVTTSAVTTTPVTTTPVTTSPVGSGSAPEGTAATVETVADGDSMSVATDGVVDEVRLLGIAAPERGECFADRSRQLLAGMAGDAVVLVGAERDQYGRRLAYVYVGATNINEEMLRSGGAIALSADHPMRSDFIAAEQEATLSGVGLWAPDACGPGTSDTTVSIWAVEADAPGRDDENPNGEFVVIANSGPPRDLTGWTLRDESSVHRYRFPEGLVIAEGQFITIRSGCGTDTATDLYWCAGGSVWNNTGDTAILIDTGGAFVSRLRYIED